MNPEHFLYKGRHRANQEILVFDYEAFHLLWSAAFHDGGWLINLCYYNDDADARISREVLSGFLTEGCFDPDLPIEHMTRDTAADNTVYFLRQQLPEAPVRSTNKTQILATVDALLSLDPAILRSQLGMQGSDEALLATAHRRLSASPYVRGGQRIRSTIWLHENGYTVST